MRTELIVAKKISQLALQVKSGVKRPKEISAPHSTSRKDAVILSSDANQVQHLKSVIASQEIDSARAEYLEQLKKDVSTETYVIDEKLAEELAVRILETII